MVIVESPTKARTLARFLGDDYKIEASYGHIRDLPQKRLGIEIEQDLPAGRQDFEPEYIQTAKQKERTKVIKKLSLEAKQIYLATYPDREGEAIAWHVSQLLGVSPPAGRAGSQESVKRVTFHEITKSAIDLALKHPGEIDMKLVDAQQARRILDRLVGYKLSPLLWKKIRRGLSAGRVQSVAVRLVVEREREIEVFKPEEYWDISVKLENSKIRKLEVKLINPEIKNQEQAEKAEKDLRGVSYVVGGVEKKDFRRTPPAPFTPSTLQQAAANRLGWSAKRTMQVAQTLYEEGYITYHRTDSTNIAAEAALMVTSFIVDRYGKEYALEKPRFYKTKSKVAQEAHEAVRPTDVSVQYSVPTSSRFASSAQLNKDQAKLYEMIWKRFVACQMAEVVGESMKVKVGAGEYKLEAKGETITFDGWYKVLGKDLEENILPEVEKGEKLKFVDLTSEQKFTEAKARYNDASLIKTLEELGIGRPSTYAPTISTIQDRQYVEKEDKRFKPTSLGIAVNDFLMTNFADIVDYKFTAKMENELDEIANGEREWRPMIKEFYEPFFKKLEEVTETAQRVKVEVETTGEKCPTCNEGEVIIRIGKFGRFLACSRFPDCVYKANYQNKTGQKCAKCGDGDVIIRKTRSGRTFYGCSNYPKCDFASWTKPKA